MSPSPFLGKLKHRKAAGSATAFHYSYHFRLGIKVELYRGSAATRLWLCRASHQPGPQSSPNCAWSSSILGPKAAPTVPGPPPSWAPTQPQLSLVLLHPGPRGSTCAWAPFLLGPHEASTVPGPLQPGPRGHHCAGPPSGTGPAPSPAPCGQLCSLPAWFLFSLHSSRLTG